MYFLLQDKKYYPTAEEVFGPEVEVRACKIISLSGCYQAAESWLDIQKMYIMLCMHLYDNQINAHALIGQSTVGYYASKPTEKLRIF